MKALVLIVDGTTDSSGEVFDPTGLELKKGRVPVTLDFKVDRRVGVATLSRIGDSVFAELELDSRTKVEDLLDLTPCVSGVAMEVVRTDTVRTLRRVLIDGIGLATSPNCDKRIKSLREQLSEK